jgi:hypothetical protein
VAALMTVSVAVLAGSVLWEVGSIQNSGTISTADFQRIKTGASRASVHDALGSPEQGMDVSNLPLPRPARSLVCEYYSESDSMMDPDVYRFCYSNNRLVAKFHYAPGANAR